MPPIQALREERSSYAKEYRNILDNNQTGALSEDVQAKLDDLETKISALDERINREQKLLDMTAQNRRHQGCPQGRAELQDLLQQVAQGWRQGPQP